MFSVKKKYNQISQNSVWNLQHSFSYGDIENVYYKYN